VPTKPKKPSGPPPGVTLAKSRQRAKVKQKRGLTVPEAVLRQQLGPHQFVEVFTDRWKGTMFGGTPQWVRHVVEAVAPVGEKLVWGMQAVLTQLAYGETTKEGGKPRASRDDRVKIHGVWWFLVSATKWSKKFCCSVRSVRNTLDTLVTLNLVEHTSRRGRYGSKTPYYRIKWEVVKYLLLVEKVMKPKETE